MSIARAFTTRRLKSSVDLGSSEHMPQRSSTSARARGGSIRNKISAPVELIHTTNMLSYNAPDLFPKSASASSARSDDESDSAPTSASTPPTSPDTPFPEKRAVSPEPNHLSCYFAAPKQALPASPASPEPTEPAAPAIPNRAPSHTKKSYDGLGLTRHRSASRLSEQSTRSVSTKASFSFSRSSSASTSTSAHTSVSLAPTRKASVASLSAAPTTPPPPPVSSAAVAAALNKDYGDAHPFGHELAQVSELAEEYASTREEDDDDALPIMNPEVPEPVPALPARMASQSGRALVTEERELVKMGLRKFSADDYLSEIRGLASMFLAEASRPIAAVWI